LYLSARAYVVRVVSAFQALCISYFLNVFTLIVTIIMMMMMMMMMMIIIIIIIIITTIITTTTTTTTDHLNWTLNHY